MHTDLSTMLGYTEVTNAVKLFTLSMADFAKLNLISQAISIGDDDSGIESSLTADKKLNKIRFDPICSDPNKSDIVIGYYKCISMERTISYYVKVFYSYAVCYAQTQIPVSLVTSAAPYLTHMLDTRIGIGFIQLADRFKEIFNESINSFNTLLIIILIISVLFTIATFIIEMILLTSVSNQFQIFKSLMLRIHPILFVANNQLISLVYGKSDKSSQIVSASRAVFTTSSDAMIFLNNEGIIEFSQSCSNSKFRLHS